MTKDLIATVRVLDQQDVGGSGQVDEEVIMQGIDAGDGDGGERRMARPKDMVYKALFEGKLFCLRTNLHYHTYDYLNSYYVCLVDKLCLM